MINPVRAQFELAAKLKKLRKDAGLSTRQLAKLTGFSQSKIARFETNRASPSAPDALVIARALGLSSPIQRSLAEDARNIDSSRRQSRSRNNAPRGLVEEADLDARTMLFMAFAHLPPAVHTPSYMCNVHLENSGSLEDMPKFLASRMRWQADAIATSTNRVVLISTDVLNTPSLARRAWLEQLYTILPRLKYARVDFGVIDSSELRVEERDLTVSIFDDELVLRETKNRYWSDWTRAEANSARSRFDELMRVADWDGAAVKRIEESIKQFESAIDLRSTSVATTT